jgi:hypothetical protein
VGSGGFRFRVFVRDFASRNGSIEGIRGGVIGVRIWEKYDGIDDHFRGLSVREAKLFRGNAEAENFRGNSS